MGQALRRQSTGLDLKGLLCAGRAAVGTQIMAVTNMENSPAIWTIRKVKFRSMIFADLQKMVILHIDVT
jgi:hypothetical protein